MLVQAILYRWFIEPLDTFTNEAVANELNSRGTDPDIIRQPAKGGRIINAFECPPDLVEYMVRSRIHSGFKFNVWRCRLSENEVVLYRKKHKAEIPASLREKLPPRAMKRPKRLKRSK